MLCTRAGPALPFCTTIPISGKASSQASAGEGRCSQTGRPRRLVSGTCDSVGVNH